HAHPRSYETFATPETTHLVEAGYDIRTASELPGHADDGLHPRPEPRRSWRTKSDGSPLTIGIVLRRLRGDPRHVRRAYPPQFIDCDRLFSSEDRFVSMIRLPRPAAILGVCQPNARTTNRES